MTEHHPELGNRYLVAMANDGRLPVVQGSRLMTKRGEMVHLEQPASLVKEVAVRQYVGGYSGWSFPIGKTGIRYRVGGSAATARWWARSCRWPIRGRWW